MANTELWKGTFVYVYEDQTDEFTKTVKGRFPAETPVTEVYDALAEKLPNGTELLDGDVEFVR